MNLMNLLDEPNKLTDNELIMNESLINVNVNQCWLQGHVTKSKSWLKNLTDEPNELMDEPLMNLLMNQMNLLQEPNELHGWTKWKLLISPNELVGEPNELADEHLKLSILQFAI